MPPKEARQDPGLEPALRVLLMVGELHKMGYQRIRIMPGMAATGLDWRCAVSHAGNFQRSHGAMLLDFDREAAHYTTGQDDEFFGWTDAQNDSPRQLADKFLERFPEIARLGRGEDPPYVEWFAQMLQLARRGAFPIAYSDYGPDPHSNLLPTTGGDQAHLPMPPGGEADLPPTH